MRLAIYQEISSVKESGTSAVAALEVGPTTLTRSTETSVIVSNKQTVVISGLMQEREEELRNEIEQLEQKRGEVAEALADMRAKFG